MVIVQNAESSMADKNEVPDAAQQAIRDGFANDRLAWGYGACS